MHKVISLILESKKKEVALLRKSLDEFKRLIKDVPRPLNFAESLKKENEIAVIAEIKQASASSGVLRKEFNLSEIVEIYNQEKVSAISVVTEEEFFLGKPRYIKEIKEKTSFPVLRKDFILDEVQVYQSRALQADAILLIAKFLKIEKLKRLYSLSKELGMEVLLEVHTLRELKEVLSFSPGIIGINNRSFDTFKVDIGTTVRLAPFVPDGTVLVSESGIKTVKDILILKGAGVDGILVGEALMRAPDIRRNLQELKVGCKS